MRYLHCIFNTYRNSVVYHHSRTLKNPNLLGFLRSNTVLYSTSANNLFRRPDLGISNERSWSFARESTLAGHEGMKVKPSDEVLKIVDEISGLTLLEVADLTEVLRKKLDVKEMPVMAMMMPGMGFGGGGGGGGGKGGVKGGGGLKVEEKKEKTAFDLKLEGFDAAAKIKIIKEVRTFTDLGLKEAKDLVEKAPTLLKKGVPKEEAEKIIAKMKEVGAKVVME